MADVWAAHDLIVASLGDVRLVQRSVAIGRRQAKTPTKSFPGSAQNKQAATRGCPSLIDHPVDSDVPLEEVFPQQDHYLPFELGYRRSIDGCG